MEKERIFLRKRNGYYEENSILYIMYYGVMNLM